MTPHRQEEAKKRVPAHVRVVVDVHCPVCGASFDDIVRQLVVKRRALREAIDTQNFEYAAALRDQIKALEEGGGRHA